MKDHKEFDIGTEQTFGRENWDLDTFIRDATERAIEGGRKVGEYLGCFSTKQLARYCRCGYQKTQKTEKKVREELMRRIDVGDRILAVSWDMVTQYQNVPEHLVWREVTARNERMVRLDQGGWYSKNNICWAEMFEERRQEAAAVSNQ